LRRSPIPSPARAALPALFDARGLLAVPHLGYLRAGASAPPVALAFQPGYPLAGQRFTVA
jgi:hypothetical protein